MASVVPEVVSEIKSPARDTIGIDYSKLSVVLIRAIQELKAENEALRRSIEELKHRSPHP